MKLYTILTILCFSIFLNGQSSIQGQLVDPESNPVEYANIALYSSVDSSLVKVETSGEEGFFEFAYLDKGSFDLTATYIGLDDYSQSVELNSGQVLDVGTIEMMNSSIELETAVVTATRAIVEVKPDRTVFNVQGTINSIGDNGLGLLRKAPGVLVNNNNNISVLGRSGVLMYVDGKRLPLSGDDLTNYLENLPAEQIDRIDIITNPGAKYEAEGNAGIIDIKLKKDKSLGTNGSLSGSYGKGKKARGNVNASGNFRNKKLNSFGVLGYAKNSSWQNIQFKNFQNGFITEEETVLLNSGSSNNFRWGTDFFLGENQIVGFLISGRNQDGMTETSNRTLISSQATGSAIDSILVARNDSESERKNNTYNINYRFDNGSKSLNIDADYGQFRSESYHNQPNTYYDPTEIFVLTETISATDTPVEIDIYTFKVDYETETLEGKLGFGTKFSNVRTDNTFLFYDIEDNISSRDDRRSNIFDYDKKVYAGYISFNRSLGEKWSFVSGLNEPPLESDYLSAFPNFGLTYQLAPEHVFQLNYGRRINRPDYNVLNPFKFQISELSFSKGNPFLKPEIVNNVELGYTLKYGYNFKLSYSKTLDQITRLIGPDDSDARASFINWDNLSKQKVFAFNISAPIEMTKGWNTYINFNTNYKDNQADYGDGVIVDIQAWSYNIYQQHTFNLPKGFRAEVSGWYSGPGIWGGVFEYETSWSLNLGLQKKLLNDQMNVRLSADDIFFQTGWSGVSSFNGLNGEGMGQWDSRRVTLSVSYNFGNENVKRSRNRSTGLEEESSRVGS